MDEAFLNDLLECSVCLEQLDSTSKVLPCQHTFCKRCLEEIVNSHKELRCPECRILVDTKVDELPCNILLIRLLEGIKNNPRLHRNSSLTGESGISRRDPVSSSGQVLPPPPPPQSPLSSSQRHGTPVGDGRVLPKQILQPLPCAKALYSYDAKEPTDLSFRKGDVIILRKRIDQNWFQGELNGKHGFLPASYLQIMVPLPSHLPQCKALYDFQMGENDEKDCLAFSKGEIITVLRRVDENWAEGKLGERIGIFPISFVEMNTAARAVMKLSANIQLGSSRIVPPTPTIEGLHVISQPVSSVGSSTAPTSNVQEPLSSTTSSPSPASSSTSPSTPGSSSSSTGSLPQSTPVSTPIATVLPIVTSVPSPTQTSPASQAFSRSSSHRSSHHKEKRHSLSAISISQRSPQPSGSHRHSMEILTSDGAVGSDSTILVTTESSPSSSPALTQSAAPATIIPTSTSHQWQESNGVKVVRRHSSRRERENAPTPPSQSATDQVPMTSSTNSTLSDSITNGTVSTSSSSSIQPSTHVPVPTFYIALYNYKPQKEDELELKKGELYTVSEKCQDGWYKGTSLRTGSSGVFPGNYVQVAKSSVPQAQFHQTSSMVASVRPTTSKTSPSSGSQAANIPPPRSKPPASCVPTSSTTNQAASHSSQSQGDPPAVAGLSANICNESSLRPHISTSPSLVSYTRPRPATSQDSRSCIPTGILDWSRSVNALCPAPQRPPRPQGPINCSTPNAPKNVVSPKQNGTSVCGPLRSPGIANWVTSWATSVPLNTNPLAIPEVPTRSVTMTASYPAVSCVISGRSAPSSSVIPCNSSSSNSGNSTNIAQSWHGTAQPCNSPHSSPLLQQSVMSAASAVTPPNVSISVCGVTSVSSTPSIPQSKPDKHKEKKEKERVSLMKRLTGKRKSKSPPPTNYSCDNPTFVDTPCSITQTSLPVVHMRSGSCPSEALGGQSSHKKTGSLDAGSSETKSTSRPKQPAPLVRERFRCIVPYPPNSEYELELQVGDIVYVHKKREDGWYKGTLQRTGKTGLFPASFVESF